MEILDRFLGRIPPNENLLSLNGLGSRIQASLDVVAEDGL